MDDFEQMWKTANSEREEEEAIANQDTPEYQIRDGMARLKILADMLINYYHAKYGEPLQEIAENPEIKFHLKG